MYINSLFSLFSPPQFEHTQTHTEFTSPTFGSGSIASSIGDSFAAINTTASSDGSAGSSGSRSSADIDLSLKHEAATAQEPATTGHSHRQQQHASAAIIANSSNTHNTVSSRHTSTATGIVAASTTTASGRVVASRGGSTNSNSNSDTQTSLVEALPAQIESPLLPQLHTRHGNESIAGASAIIIGSISNSSTTTSQAVNNTNSSNKIGQKCIAIGEQQSSDRLVINSENSVKKCVIYNKKPVNSSIVGSKNTKKYQIKSSSVGAIGGSAATATTAIGAKKPTYGSTNSVNMVAMQELINSSSTNGGSYDIDDPSQELQYGPGIVSKLRCRYLSLALRQTVSKQRPSLDNLRRATSLNNLLDEADEEEDDDEDEEDDDGSKKSWNSQRENGYGSGKGRMTNNVTNGGAGDYGGRQQQPSKGDSRCRQVQRGNDSLKRARSVEALTRYDNRAWRRDVIKDSEEYPSSNPIILDELIVSDHHPPPRATAHLITIEDKIQSTRERHETSRPKRLTSFMDETERPPPDLVKQTLLKFEATANRKPRLPSRYANGDVAAKVASYKNIMAQDKDKSKPPMANHQPPLSPIKKPLAKPRTASPKPVPATFNGCDVVKDGTRSFGGINTLRANQQRGINGNNGSNGLANRLQTPLASIRVDTTSYRNSKIMDTPTLSPPNSQSPRSPLSPSRLTNISRLSPIASQRPELESPKLKLYGADQDAVIISQLVKKTSECLNISTPRPLSGTHTQQQQQQPPPKVNGMAAEFDSEGEEHTLSESESVDGCALSVNGSISPPIKQRCGKKHISKSALENISKAGTTTKFQFELMSNTPTTTNKSHLPTVAGGFLKRNVTNGSTATVLGNGNGEHAAHATVSAAPEPSVRQIGIIRPLLAEPKIQARPPPPPSSSLNNFSAVKREPNESVKVQPAPPISSATAMAGIDAEPKCDNFLIANLLASTATPMQPMQPLSLAQPLQPQSANNMVLSSREIQKNLINREKSEDNGLAAPKWITKRSVTVSATAPTVPPPQPPSNQTNSMVFNFKHRKEVPDYIENDGLVIRRKREMPKVSFVFFFGFFLLQFGLSSHGMTSYSRIRGINIFAKTKKIFIVLMSSWPWSVHISFTM